MKDTLYSGKVPTDYIPKISEERLRELAGRMKPLIKRDGKLIYVTNKNLKTVAFTWVEAGDLGATAGDEIVPFMTITTYHGFAYHGFFKPSQAEVLAAINKQLSPAELIQVVAYSTQGPHDAEELNQQIEAVNDGYHKAVTTLYKSTTADVTEEILSICAMEK
jgi:hypothetical protein